MPVESSGSRTYIVTGGNSGLGYASARCIAQQDALNCVILACRDAGKARAAATALAGETGNLSIAAIDLDLGSLASVRRFAAAFRAGGHPPLAGLVCNAGVINLDATRYTSDGFEATFGVNHLGHFLLTALLSDCMADGGRIVFVSSGTHDPANRTLVAPPQYENAQLLAHPIDGDERINSLGQRRYSTSKLCNVYCAYEFADRFMKSGKQVLVNAFDPGEMPGTGFSRSFPAPMRFFAKYVNYASVPFRSGAHTPKQSAKALTSLLTSTDFNGITGKYFEGTREAPSSQLSYDADNRADLWRTSVELSGLTDGETTLSLV